MEDVKQHSWCSNGLWAGSWGLIPSRVKTFVFSAASRLAEGKVSGA
jgi:hypothetical protein